MLLSKKITKLTKNSKSSAHNSSPSKKVNQEKRKPKKCRFQLIPLPIKFIPPEMTYLLYGDIPLTKCNNNLVFDISLYNKFMLFQGVTTRKMFGQTVISIKPTRKMNNELVTWSEFVRELLDLEMLGWSEIVRIYSEKYEKVMRRQSRKKAKTGARKKFFVQATGETEERKRKLFEEFPCIYLKFRLKEHENRLSEIIFSEGLVISMGYSIETFASAILQEGIPQFWSFESSSSSFVLESLLTNYFALELEKRQVLDLESVLLLKNGFMRDITYQMHFLMNYETNTFGLDIIIAITSKSEPYFAKGNIPLNLVSQNFVDFKVDLETEASRFLIEYYQTIIQGRYQNMDKICTIRELDFEDDDDIVVKKYEDI